MSNHGDHRIRSVGTTLSDFQPEVDGKSLPATANLELELEIDCPFERAPADNGAGDSVNSNGNG